MALKTKHKLPYKKLSFEGYKQLLENAKPELLIVRIESDVINTELNDYTLDLLRNSFSMIYGNLVGNPKIYTLHQTIFRDFVATLIVDGFFPDFDNQDYFETYLDLYGKILVVNKFSVEVKQLITDSVSRIEAHYFKNPEVVKIWKNTEISC
jgi:hypothetical protein